MMVMTVHLSSTVERILSALAARTGRDVNAVVEDAVRQYLASANFGDMEPDAIARVQMDLLSELGMTEPWDAHPGSGTNAQR